MDTKSVDLFQDDDLLIIAQEKESGMNFRKRRHTDWNDNYTLWRDKIITNRLTQRQTINIPLMKYGLATIMKDIDEPPMLYFECIDNDQQKEIYYNEYWKDTATKGKLIIKSLVDKRQGLLYGRSFKKLNIQNGRFTFEVIDPQDMLVDRYIDPADIDTARCIIQTGIYRTLSSIVENESYLKEGKSILKTYFSDNKTLEAEKNYTQFVDKEERMANLGLIDVLNPVVGETYIELNEVYRKEFNKKTNEVEIYLYIIACTSNGMIKLFKEPLEKVIGETDDNFWKTHFPFTTLTTEPERIDFWNDGPADVIRQPNKVLNSWASQLVENRTLKNFNMHYYDSSNPDFVPQTYMPETWGWYPTPGNPNDVIKDVAVADLSDSLDELTFIIGIAEKSIAASGTNNGAVEQRQVTLGEVQLAITNAQERTKSLNTFIIEDWKDFGLKYSKMLEANSDSLDPVKIYKKGREGKKIYSKEITPKMYLAKSGYIVEVKMKNDKLAEDASVLEKLNATISVMPNNLPLVNIYKTRLLEFTGMSSTEIKEVMDFEKQNVMNTPQVTEPMNQQTGQPTAQGSTLPQVPDIQPVNNLQGGQ